MKKFSRILVLLLVLTMVSGVLLAAPLKLELFYYKQEIRDALREMADEFTSENPDITIDLTVVPNEGITVLRTRLASGQAPDIIQLQSYSQVFEFARAGYLMDLSGTPIMNKVVDSSMNAVTYNGKAYSLPMDMAGIGIIYNKDLFTQAGIENLPTTYRELKTVARKLKNAGITPFAGLLKANWSAGHFITLVHTELLGAEGGNEAILNWIDEMNKGEGSYGGPIDVDDLFDIMDFYQDNMALNSIEWDWTEQQDAFGKGQAAMMVQGLWSYNAVLGNTEATINVDNVGFIPFPVTKNSEDTKFYADVDSTLAISSQSTPEKKEAAMKFLEWLSTPKAIEMWTTKANLTSTFKGADMSGMKLPYQELMESVNNDGAYPWAFSMYPVSVFEDACKNGAQQYFFGRKSADEVIEGIDALWRSEIGK